MIIPLSYRLLLNDKRSYLVYERDLNGFALLFLMALPLVLLSFLLPTVVSDEHTLLGLFWIHGTFFLLMLLFVGFCVMGSSSSHGWILRYRLREAPLTEEEVASLLPILEKTVPSTDHKVYSLLAQRRDFATTHLLLTAPSGELSQRLKHAYRAEKRKELLKRQEEWASSHVSKKRQEALQALQTEQAQEEEQELTRRKAFHKDATKAEAEVAVLEAWRGDKLQQP